jgi:hypothetical protein
MGETGGPVVSWRMVKKRAPKLRPDVAETAYRVYMEAIGEAPHTLPPEERTEKNAVAVRRGRLGGKKGGKARAKVLGAKRRKQAAKKAAKKRWETADKSAE